MAINFLNTVAVDENVLFVDTVNDRVGIGTASPGTKLDVHVAGTGIRQYGDANNILSTYAGSGYQVLEATNSGTTNAFGYNSGAFYVETAAAERMRITSTGYVGIGTTAPGAKLEVKSSANLNSFVNITTTTDAYDSGISLRQSSNYGFDVYYSDDGVSPSVRGLYFDRVNNGSVANAMFIDRSGGNVGIATTSPSEKLDVVGNIKITSALLSNQNNTDVDTGAEVVAQVAHATYTAAFFDFVVKKGTNVRSGTVYACHNGDSTPLVEFTETSTNDLGDTSDVTLSVDISGANMRLVATVTSDDWSVKSLIRAI